MLLVDYRAELDLTNTNQRRFLPTLDLTVRHQPGSDRSRIVGARVSVSYDDGGTWHRGAVLPRGRGEFTALLLPVIPPAGAEFASLRVEAWDRAGNRIEQEVTPRLGAARPRVAGPGSGGGAGWAGSAPRVRVTG